MASSSGGQMLVGIRLEVDAKGAVTGAALAEQALDRVQTKAQQTQGTVKTAAMGMGDAMAASMGVGAIGGALMGVGNAIQSGFVQPAMEQAKSFETEMSQLKFVTGATAEEMKRLEDFVIEVGRKTQFSPQKAASAVRMLKAAGLETDAALKSVAATIDIVVGSGGTLELQSGATATAAAMLKFSRTGESAREIMDAFAQSTRETNMQMRDLPIVINSLRDAPSKLKLTAAQAFSLVGVMRSAGMQAAQAAQSVDMFANKFIQNQGRIQRYLTKKGITEEQLLSGYTDEKMPLIAKSFQQLGVQLFDSKGKMKDMTQFMGEMIRSALKLSGESEKEYLVAVNQVFGARASGIVSALKHLKKEGKEGGDAWMALVKNIESGAGASREAAAAIENTATGMAEFIKGTEETIQIIMGKAMLPHLAKFQVGIRSVLDSLLDFTKENPVIAESFGVVIIALGAVAKLAGAVALGFAGLLFWTSVVAPALAVAGGFAGIAATGFAALQAAMWPILIVGAAILALFALVTVGMKVWSMIWAKDAGKFFKSIRGFLESIQMIWKGVKEFWDGEGSMDLQKKLKEMGLWGAVTRILWVKERVVAILGGIWQGVKEIFTPMALVIMWVGEQISRLINWVQELLFVWGVVDLNQVSTDWREFGRVIGWIAGVLMVLLIAKTLMWVGSLLAAAGAQLILAGAAIYTMVAWLAVAALAIILVTAIGLALWQLGKMLWSFLKSVADAVVSAYRQVVNFVEGVIAFWVGLWSGEKSGSGFIDSFMAGVKSAWNTAKSFFSGIAQSIRDFFPGSDAKVGPLSNITASGRGLLNAMGQGVMEEAPQLRATVTHALGQIGSAPADGTAAGVSPLVKPKGSTTINIHRMEFQVASGTPEEIEQLARKILEKIRTLTDDEQEVSFA